MITKIKEILINNIFFLTYIIVNFINSFILRLVTVNNFYSIEPLLCDLSLIIFIGSFMFLLNEKVRFRYLIIVSSIMCFICVSNSIYYDNYSSFVTLSQISATKQMMDIKNAIFSIIEFKHLIYLICIPILIFVGKKNKSVFVKNSFIYSLIISISLFLVFCLLLVPTDWGKLTKQWYREFIVMKFGVYFYQVNDIVINIVPSFNSYVGSDQASIKFNYYFDNKVNSIVPNEYTNIFLDKNLLVIHAESIQNFVINEKINNKEITPFLNKLVDEGLYFSNFYSQDSLGTSSDSEFTFNSSLLPASDGIVFINYWDRFYITIPKLLKEKGYYTFSMHGNDGNFWNRILAHESLGYNKFYYQSKDYVLDETIGLGLSDKSFFNQSINYIKDISKNNSKFYGTMIMLTNHTPFTDIDELSDFDVTNSYIKDGVLIKNDFLEGTTLGSYIKSVNYADSAIELFINELDKSGLLENTVIVIYGDHDSKIQKEEFEKFYNYDRNNGNYYNIGDSNYYDFNDFEYELNRKVPFIIWSKDIKLNEEVNKPMGMIDIFPTLGNMFGFSNHYALGNDIFSAEDNTVVFPNGNWLTDKVYYDNQKQEKYLLTTTDVTLDYLNRKINYSNNIVQLSNDIIVYDLLKKYSD